MSTVPTYVDKQDVYEVFARMGDCMVCGKHKDLRCGACFDCSSKIDGERIANGKGHRLWERANPDNAWIVGA